MKSNSVAARNTKPGRAYSKRTSSRAGGRVALKLKIAAIGTLASAVVLMAVPIFSLTSLQVQAAPMSFFGHGGISQFNKNVTSMRERRYVDLVEQKYDFSCGAAAVTTILKYAYNQDLTELEVIAGMIEISDEEVVKEKGFSLLDVRHYVETLGLRGRGYNIPPANLSSIRIPTIVLLEIRGYKHFVVLKRVIGDDVYIGDPALGNRIMAFDDFIDSWNGVIFAIVGRGFDRNTVLISPPAQLTVRKFLYDQAPITNSELLDFGFTHAELF